MLSIGLDVPISGTAHNLEEARQVTEMIVRFPLIIRPAFTLGGTGGGIAYNREEFDEMAKRGQMCIRDSDSPLTPEFAADPAFLEVNILTTP